MKTAKLIKDNLPGFRGNARLYELSEPTEYGYDFETGKPDGTTKFLVVSTISFFGLETFIFPADKTGKVLNWSEMEGSRKGTSSHGEVLKNAGYRLAY